jgi:hypothetical protein
MKTFGALRLDFIDRSCRQTARGKVGQIRSECAEFPLAPTSSLLVPKSIFFMSIVFFQEDDLLVLLSLVGNGETYP